MIVKFLLSSFLWVTHVYMFLEDNKREALPSLKDIRKRCINQLEQMRPDHMRRLNPTPYKVVVYYLIYYSIIYIYDSEFIACFLNRLV